MVNETNFDDIRPFNDSDVDEALRMLLEDEKFQQILLSIFKDPKKIEQVKWSLQAFIRSKIFS